MSTNPYHAIAHDTPARLASEWAAWVVAPPRGSVGLFQHAHMEAELEEFAHRARDLGAADLGRIIRERAAAFYERGFVPPARVRPADVVRDAADAAEMAAHNRRQLAHAVLRPPRGNRRRFPSPVPSRLRARAAAAALTRAVPLAELKETFRALLLERQYNPAGADAMCATLREEARGLTAPYASEGAPFQPDGLFPEVSVPLAEYIVARAMLARACGKAALDVRAAGLAAGWPLRAGPAFVRPMREDHVAAVRAALDGAPGDRAVLVRALREHAPGVAAAFADPGSMFSDDLLLLLLYLFAAHVHATAADAAHLGGLAGMRETAPETLETLAGAAAQAVLGFAQFGTPDLRPAAQESADAFQAAYIDAMRRFWAPGENAADYFRWSGELPNWDELRAAAAALEPPEIAYALAATRQ